jgi:hypothetical protein
MMNSKSKRKLQQTLSTLWAVQPAETVQPKKCCNQTIVSTSTIAITDDITVVKVEGQNTVDITNSQELDATASSDQSSHSFIAAAASESSGNELLTQLALAVNLKFHSLTWVYTYGQLHHFLKI